jgi:hypothetical protein
VLVAIAQGGSGTGVLPPSAMLEAAIMATGPGAPTDPLFVYRFRTSRYRDLADWGHAMRRAVGIFADPGLPDALWAGTGPLTISEPALLPLLKEARPETPLLRRMSRANKPPVLLVAFPEPLPLHRVDFALWEPPPVNTAGGAAPTPQEPEVELTTQQVAFQSEYLVPLSRHKGAATINGKANPITRLQIARHDRGIPELANIPPPPSAPRAVAIKVIWLEDGSHAFILPTDAAERLTAGRYDLEVRYVHMLPDAAGNRVIDVITVPLEIPGP